MTPRLPQALEIATTHGSAAAFGVAAAIGSVRYVATNERRRLRAGLRRCRGNSALSGPIQGDVLVNVGVKIGRNQAAFV